MTKIETKIHKQNANDIVGVKVAIYDTLKREIDKIIAIDDTDYNYFLSQLNNHTHNYIEIDNIDSLYQIVDEEILHELDNNYGKIRFTLENNGDLYIEY